MTALDERARRAAASVRRLADTVDAEQVLDRIEDGAPRTRWLAPAWVVAAGAAVVLCVVAVGALLTADTVRIDNDPGVVASPGDVGDDRWPPAGHESEDGWIHLDREDHGIQAAVDDVAAWQDGFVLVAGHRVWRSDDGISWELASPTAMPVAQLAVDRDRIVAMGWIDGGRELRIAWSTDGGRTWRDADGETNPALRAGPQESFSAPQLVAGPRGFLIAGAVWTEQDEPTGGVSGPANAGATIRVLESPDGASWSVTQEWQNTGPAHLVGVAGDTEGYTLVFQGDDQRGEVDKGTTRAFASGDEGWVELPDHPGGRPVRITRERPVSIVGDGPDGDHVTTNDARFHTWSFSVGPPVTGLGVHLRTARGWEQAVFEGETTSQPGWHVSALWDAGDALYAHVVGADPATSTLYRSGDGYRWTELPRDPVFVHARPAGDGVVAATSDTTSVLVVSCCEGGAADGARRPEFWVRRDRSQLASRGPAEPPARAEGCEAAGLPAEPEPQPGLPGPVADMRAEIASAAVRCDHGLLAELAMAGTGEFTASFGGVGDLATYFRDHADLRLMRRLLDLPHAVATDANGVTYYAWPSAFLESTDEAWQALYDAQLATPDDRTEMEEAFDGWIGLRHGITDDGDWIFSVAGD